MRTLLSLCCCLLVAGAAGAAQKDAPERPVRKGDTLSVKGCLNGSSLEATETSAAGAAPLAGSLTFRLTGDKKLLRALRDRHNRRIVEVTGLLKSNLPQPGAQPRTLGGMRIGIGTTSPGAGRPEGESRRVLPVLEVKEFDGGTTYCGR